MPQRLDTGSLGTAQRTAQGGLAIPATLTRAGVFEYLRADGKMIREWRPLAEVSRPETIASLKNAPVTVRHPSEGRVGPDNYRRHVAGNVGEDVRMDGQHTVATVYVQAADALRSAAAFRDVSCGYDCGRVDETPGVVPAGEPDAGKPYDRIQRDITYNHLAIAVARGRAGSARLYLDAADNAVEEPMQKVEVIGGIEYEVGTPAHADARGRADAADKALKDDNARLRTDAAEAKGKLDAALTRLAALEADAKARQDAADREALVKRAQPVLGKDWKADGLSNEQITAAIIGKAFPEVKLDSVPEAERPAYIKGLLAAVPAAPAAPAPKKPTEAPFRADAAPGARPVSTVARARQDSHMESDGMCGRPMAISRRKPEPFLQPTQTEQMR